MAEINRTSPSFFSSIVVLCALISATGIGNIYGQAMADSSKQVLLASFGTKNISRYILKESNVIFPDILKGNEALSASYIADFSAKRKNYLVSMYTKGKKFLPKINVILKKYNLPGELGVLMMLESAGNANAVSKAGAVGYWQIMDEVAKEYGLKYARKMSAAEKKKLLHLNPKKANAIFKAMARQKDERKNFNKSTAAAARYLNDRRLNLDNNWLLVAASYNCGVGNVWDAMKKSGKNSPDFWDIKQFLPAETQAYVMNFIALNVIFSNYDNFINNNLNFTPVEILIPDDFKQNNTELSEDVASPLP
jgi:hypothetical protein